MIIRTADRIAETLVHLGRAAAREDGASTLTAAQWACLRFLARANVASRTPSGFAAVQATTRGTASQIVKSLALRGLIIAVPSDLDRRSTRFDLTAAGHDMLADDPLRALSGIVAKLGQGEQAALLSGLSALAADFASLRAAPVWGSCGDCTHFAAAAKSSYCACIAAKLAANETEKLCLSFAPADADTAKGTQSVENGHR